MAPLALRLLVSSFAVLATATISASVHKGAHLHAKDAKDSKDKKKNGPTPASLHRVAKKAANFVESRAKELGSVDLHALSLKLGQLPAASEDYVKNFKDMKELVGGMMKARKSGKNELDLENFCSAETKRASKRATTLATRKKTLETSLTSEAGETDTLTKKVAHLDSDVASTQKRVEEASKKRKVGHARYLKASAAEKKEEAKSKHPHGKISLANAADVQKETNRLDVLLQHSIALQSAEAAAVLTYTRSQRRDSERIQNEHEAEVNGKHHLKTLRKDLMKKANEYKAVDVDIAHLKTYRAALAKQCQSKATQHMTDQHRKDEVQALLGAYRILLVPDV